MTSTTTGATDTRSVTHGNQQDEAQGVSRADTWPGPAAPLVWLATLALIGALLGGLIGALVGATGDESVTASATFEVVPDERALGNPLATTTTNTNTDTFVEGQLQALESLRQGREDDDASLAVTQVGTADVLRISATAPTADQATAAVSGLLDAYVAARQEAAGASVTAALAAVQQRLDALSVLGGTDEAGTPVGQEVQRLLSQQSELQAATTRVPGIVPVLRGPTADDASGAPAWLLSGLVGAVLGAVLLLAAGAVWRATTSRMFDARLLVAAGVTVLLPRLPAGRVRGRGRQVPNRVPNARALSAARLLVPQVTEVGRGAGSLAVFGADERAGASEVVWELAWAIASGGAPVALLTTTSAAHAERPGGQRRADGTERVVTSALSVVELPAQPDDDALAAAVAQQRAAGRQVLLHAPALTAGVRAHDLARHVDRAVVVVGEGVSSLESALAAVRDVSASSAPLLGVVVTTTSGHLGRSQVEAPAGHPAEETTSPRQETIASEV